jgi:hypothetical protein
VKFSRIAGVVRWSGGTTLLRRNQSADDDHPLVVERPDLWTDEVPGASLSSARKAASPAVERATRAPGEVRQTPRRGPGRTRKVTEPEVDPAAGQVDTDE